jgi:ubiquinone/menaquinone biosynthesis C-methylase UbiE
MLAQAQSAVSRRLHWIHASAERTGLRDAQYDLTFCVDVVHHLSDRDAVFQERIAFFVRKAHYAWRPIPKT